MQRGKSLRTNQPGYRQGVAPGIIRVWVPSTMPSLIFLGVPDTRSVGMEFLRGP